jgi:hypothetical protein
MAMGPVTSGDAFWTQTISGVNTPTITQPWPDAPYLNMEELLRTCVVCGDSAEPFVFCSLCQSAVKEARRAYLASLYAEFME